MTSPTSPSTGPRLLTRRQGLGLLATAVPLGLIAACGNEDSATPPTALPQASQPPSLAQQVAAEEAGIIALYDAALAALPPDDARPLLLAIRDEHEQHRAALAAEASPGSTASGDEAAGDSVGGIPDGDISVAMLVDAERAAVKNRIRACAETQDAELARVLALIGASEAGHVPALRSLT